MSSVTGASRCLEAGCVEFAPLLLDFPWLIRAQANQPVPNKEAKARIKINRLLEDAGWRFFADAKGPANIQLEPSVTLTKQELDDLRRKL